MCFKTESTLNRIVVVGLKIIHDPEASKENETWFHGRITEMDSVF